MPDIKLKNVSGIAEQYNGINKIIVSGTDDSNVEYTIPPNMQNKQVYISTNGTHNITPSVGYDSLSSVSVEVMVDGGNALYREIPLTNGTVTIVNDYAELINYNSFFVNGTGGLLVDATLLGSSETRIPVIGYGVDEITSVKTIVFGRVDVTGEFVAYLTATIIPGDSDSTLTITYAEMNGVDVTASISGLSMRLYLFTRMANS